MSILESQSEQTLEFKIDPAMLAQACQETIESMGLTIKEVSRESGIITAKKPMLTFDAPVNLMLKIIKTGNGACVQIKVSAHDSILVPGEAQKFLAKFIGSLSTHPSLKGSSIAGW